MHVLVVEEESDSTAHLLRGLHRHGFETASARSGAQALELCSGTDLVLLDLELPDVDGLEVCRNIRSSCDIPIISLTDRNTELDRVLGLQAGSDDCLGKPYALRELVARIEAVLRRTRSGDPATPGARVLTCGPLYIDITRRGVWLSGEPVQVTRKEFDLLYQLAVQPGVVVTRRQLMARVWQEPLTHPLSSQVSRTIDTHVSTLRSKLGASTWIQTVRGVGFRLGQG